MSAIRDFSGAAEILRHQYGTSVKVVDHPTRGTRGVLDAADRFEKVTSGRTRSLALGKKRVEDITLRLNVIKAAQELAAAAPQFSDSAQTDSVNKKLWTMGFGGRMQVRKFLENGKLGSPAAAIRDIFQNGDKYAFECATAMMVILHKAILDTIGDKAFDALFSEPSYLTFFRWTIKDDDYLKLERMGRGGDKLLPGSHYYYENPDASQANSAFQGENVIYLGEQNGEKMFYAHGITGQSGSYLVTEKEILAELAAYRKPGARKQPFRKDFRYSLDAAALNKMVAGIA